MCNDTTEVSQSFKTMISCTKEVSVMSSRKTSLRPMVLAGMFLALAMVLPFLTGQIPQIGAALSPMHIPALLAGFFCGPWWAAAVGLVAPPLRYLLFGMPPIMPTGVAMSFELAAYGLTAGLLYRYLPKQNIYVYVSLIGAMLTGRLVWGAARVILFALGHSAFSWAAFIAGAFVNAVPGIIVHIILIPIVVIALKKHTAEAE